MVIVGLFLNNEMRTGANRRYIELMNDLSKKGHRVFVVMNSFLEIGLHNFIDIKIPIAYKRKSFPPASFLFKCNAKKIARSIRKELDACYHEQVDWILIHGDMHLPLAVSLKKMLNAKLFFASRCNDVLRAKIMRKSGFLNTKEKLISCIYELVNRRREKMSAHFSNLICFQNSFDKEDWLRRINFSDDRTVIIPGNIGLPRCTQEWKNVNTNKKLVSLVYVGVLSASKGFYYVLDVLKKIHDLGIELKLSVLGTIKGAENAQVYATSLGINSLISWEGYTDPFPFLREASLLIFPSLYDAFPDTILESLHVGCPVIASTRGGIPDILGNTELLFEPSDVESMALFIQSLCLDEKKYQRIKEYCAERAALFRFDWADKWVKAMENH